MLLNHSIRSVLAIAAIGSLATGCGSLLSSIQPSATQTEQTQTTQTQTEQKQAEPAQVAQASSSPSATDSESARNRTPYPADVVQNFMNACIQSGGNQPACSCLFSKIQERYTVQEFARLEEESKASGKLPQEIADFAVACRS